MSTIRRFEEIEAWQVARASTRQVYEVSNRGGFARDFGLRDQMRRAAVSIMSNPSTGHSTGSQGTSGHRIAEGFESRTQALFVEFLGRAKGSAGEVRAQLYVTLDAGYLDQPQFDQLFALAEKCSRQISCFISYLESLPNSRRIREDGVAYHASTLERSNVETFQPANHD